MNNEYFIRLVTPADAAEVLSVYKPYVETTSNTFEYEVPSVEEISGRISAIIPHFPWLVCLHNGSVIGYAYAHKHRERAAYQWSPESTVYLAQAYHSRGIARILYDALFAMLRLQGFVNVYAGVLSTNSGSNHLHRAAGFEEIGIYKNIGYKLGEWHSNIWYQLHLTAHHPHPANPLPMSEIINTGTFISILEAANSRLAKNPALVT